MRIVKEHGERLNEFLDTAESLFASKGYNKTTINDIIEAVNVAKGTFYHYFKSKEEVMDAIVDRLINKEIASAKAIADNASLTAHEKMYRLITGEGRDTSHKDKMVAESHQVNNAEMHQKSMVASVLRLSPIMTEIVQQGVREGTFKTEQPQEKVEFLLAASEFLLDETIFPWQPEELLEKAKAFSIIAETLLGVEKGSFSYIHARYEEQLQRKGGVNR
ncbi:TetR/AcrR family transcriptional regulator [Desulfovibrio cuneatus]|uniref:TetR/AcrR family transcriptional regulator n=1 Tax=Desulfovibrio cuneatus TaxID=159728 RepID=UPI0004052F5E|nr:TetR/AcrR family transcriptional regulator [Desulfovibrio cuneatus]